MRSALIVAAFVGFATATYSVVAAAAFDTTDCEIYLDSGNPPQRAIEWVDAIPQAERGLHDHLCRGMAHTRLEHYAEAQADFGHARVLAADGPDAWLVAGHEAQALDGRPGGHEVALRGWAAGIRGAAAAGDSRQEFVFRARRAVSLANHGRPRESMADFEWLYGRAPDQRYRASLALEAAKAGVMALNAGPTERWARRAIEDARATGQARIEGKAHMLIGDVLTQTDRHEAGAEAYARAGEAMSRAGDVGEQAEAAEMEGQARFESGDYAGGDRDYGRGVTLFASAGEHEYAEWMLRNLRSKRGLFENGFQCHRLLNARQFDRAVRSVDTMPPEHRSGELERCRAQALRREVPRANPVPQVQALEDAGSSAQPSGGIPPVVRLHRPAARARH